MKAAHLVLAIFLGYFLNDMTRELPMRVMPDARADIAGMNAYELKNDREFRRAVMTVAEEECRTDLRGRKTYFYCNVGGRFDPN